MENRFNYHFKKWNCWDHFFEDLTEIQPFHVGGGKYTLYYSTCWVFYTRNFRMYFDENKLDSKWSFVTVTWKSALLEITDAKNQYNSIPKWFSPEIEADWTECFLLPTSTVFCGRHFEVTFCFFSKWSLQSHRQFLKCNL